MERKLQATRRLIPHKCVNSTHPSCQHGRRRRTRPKQVARYVEQAGIAVADIAAALAWQFTEQDATVATLETRVSSDHEFWLPDECDDSLDA